MVFELIKWYAIARGIRRALRRRKPNTLADVDSILKSIYVEPIREVLNRQSVLLFERYEWEPEELTISDYGYP